MDYYSGTPEPENYSYTSPGSNENPNDNDDNNSFFKTHYNAIMIGLASVTAILILILILTGSTSSKGDDGKALDNNSNLSELVVTGGTMTPDFMSGTINYTIRAKTNKINFSCKTVSEDSTVFGCDDEITVTSDKITHEIVVTSKNGKKTTYYLTIVKAQDFQEE